MASLRRQTDKNVQRFFINAFVFALIVSMPLSSVFAGEHSTHVHGVSQMTVAVENQSLEIQLTSPAMDLLGFEHKAESEKAIEMLKQVSTQLNNHAQLFQFEGRVCEHVQTTLDTSHFYQSDKHHSDESHKDQHEHDHAGHSELVANYQYYCECPSALSELSVTLFDHFPDIHKMNVMWVTERLQGFVVLTKGNQTIEFK